MPQFNELFLFVQVVQAGSFTTAADRLGVSKSALSQRLSQLERNLGVRLLNRTTRSIAPTAAGEQLYRQIADKFTEIQSGLSALSDFQNEPSGTVKINAPHVAVQAILLPKLQPLLADNPKLNLEIFVDNRWADIVAEGVDMGVRLGDTVAKDMITVQISPPMKMILAASAGYLATHGTPQTLDDLEHHHCIATRLSADQHIPMAWELNHEGRLIKYQPNARLVINAPNAVQFGYGIAWLPEMLVQNELASGELVQVLLETAYTFEPLYLYYPSRKGNSNVFRLVVETLRFGIGLKE